MNLRELDALIAEHVFGWKREEVTMATKSDGYWKTPGLVSPRAEVFAFRYPDAPNTFLPRYSTDIALAIGVLEKLRMEKEWGWQIRHGGCWYRVTLETGTSVDDEKSELFSHMPLPEAICRHVIHVLGVEKK